MDERTSPVPHMRIEVGTYLGSHILKAALEFPDVTCRSLNAVNTLRYLSRHIADFSNQLRKDLQLSQAIAPDDTSKSSVSLFRVLEGSYRQPINIHTVPLLEPNYS
jgi:hypothetical protein